LYLIVLIKFKCFLKSQNLEEKAPNIIPVTSSTEKLQFEIFQE